MARHRVRCRLQHSVSSLGRTSCRSRSRPRGPAVHARRSPQPGRRPRVIRRVGTSRGSGRAAPPAPRPPRKARRRRARRGVRAQAGVLVARSRRPRARPLPRRRQGHVVPQVGVGLTSSRSAGKPARRRGRRQAQDLGAQACSVAARGGRSGGGSAARAATSARSRRRRRPSARRTRCRRLWPTMRERLTRGVVVTAGGDPAGVRRGRQARPHHLTDATRRRPELVTRGRRQVGGVPGRGRGACSAAGGPRWSRPPRTRRRLEDAGDRVVREVDQARAARIPGPPILSYDSLTAAQITARMGDLKYPRTCARSATTSAATPTASPCCRRSRR